MVYIDTGHEVIYKAICREMKRVDCYHKALAYLISLDTVCRDHIREIFDFEENAIKIDCLDKGWQTGTSHKTVRLAFNLWNGYCTDGDTYIDKNGYENDLPSSRYTPENIFCCSYAPYYWQAVQLRYPEYTKTDELCYYSTE